MLSTTCLRAYMASKYRTMHQQVLIRITSQDIVRRGKCNGDRRIATAPVRPSKGAVTYPKRSPPANLFVPNHSANPCELATWSKTTLWLYYDLYKIEHLVEFSRSVYDVLRGSARGWFEICQRSIYHVYTGKIDNFRLKVDFNSALDSLDLDAGPMWRTLCKRFARIKN